MTHEIETYTVRGQRRWTVLRIEDGKATDLNRAGRAITTRLQCAMFITDLGLNRRSELDLLRKLRK